MSAVGHLRSRSGRTSRALDNLRGYVILLVIAFHSSLAYLAFLPARPGRFDSPPFAWRAFPIIDTHRSVGLELFCAWQDIFLMSLFFFLSGLFVWPSLERKGALRFMAERLRRLGLPFALGVGLLMPAALYPSYLQSGGAPAVGTYLHRLATLPLWPSGPLWFLWLLLAADLIAVLVHRVLPGWGRWLGRWSAIAGSRPAGYFARLFAVSAVAYLPLALAFTAQAWGQWGPFALQLSRPAHYAVYFAAGAGLGAGGIERGLFAPTGTLARHWRFWLALAAGSFALWLAVTSRVMAAANPVAVGLQIGDALVFVLACLGNCFGVIAATLRWAATPRGWLTQLSVNAYGMYLVHYFFVVWLQYALLPVDLPGAVKAGLVFAATSLLSWTTVTLARQLARLFALRVVGHRAAAHPG